MNVCNIGIDIGGMSIKGGLVDSSLGKIVYSFKATCEKTKNDFVKALKSILDELFLYADNNGIDVNGIGIGVPGICNKDKCEIEFMPNLDVGVVEIGKELESYNLPIKISNDANVAALGEQKYGCGKKYDDVIMLTLGTGVGGGIIINKKLFEGWQGKGAELGHMVINPDGPECNCGRRGCFEKYASATALIEDAKQVFGKSDSLINNYSLEEIQKDAPKILFECAKLGDKVSNEIVDKYINNLCLGICNLLNIFRPQAIILGGGVSNQGKYLKQRVEVCLKDQNYGYKHMPTCDVLIAELVNDAGIIGAAALI